MKNKYRLLALLTFLMVTLPGLSACGGAANPEPAEIIPINLTLGYIPNIQFAPIYVAIDKGYFRNAGFDVSLTYGNEADAVALIGAGEQTFAVASGEQVLLARAQGLPVTYVAAWYQHFPVGVVALQDSDIQVPEDLLGTSIGIPGLYGASYIGLRALLAAADLNETDVELRSIGFTQVESLVTDQVDATVIYLANEPAVLRSQGYAVDVIRVADYLKLVANGLVTNEATITDDPIMVTAFIDAMLHGLADTYTNPDEAYEISKGYVENLAEQDPALQSEILVESIKLWQSENPGYSHPAGWINMQNVLLDMGLLTEPLDLDKAFTNDLLP